MRTHGFASEGHYVVLVTQDDRAVQLNLVPDNALVTALVNRRPGPGKPMTLSVEALQRHEPRQQGFQQAVRTAVDADVRLFGQMMSIRPIGNDYFTVTVEQGHTK